MDDLRYLDSQDAYIIIIIVVAFLLIAIIPFVFYLLTLQNALKAVSPENRKMPPGNVWLLFIPLFNYVWLFFVVDAIGISFKREYEKYGVFMNEKPTYGLGLTVAILQCCFIVPLINFFAFFGGFICWIIYWVKVNTCKNELLNMQYNSNLPEGEKFIFL